MAVGEKEKSIEAFLYDVNLLHNKKDGGYYIYVDENGIYQEVSKIEINQIFKDRIKQEEDIEWTTSLQSKLENSLPTFTAYKDLEPRRNCIVLQNGTYNISLHTLEEHSAENNMLHREDYQFDVNAECPSFMKFISDIACGDSDLIATIEELLGYVISSDIDAGKLIFLEGGGSNGKSTFFKLCKSLMGDETITSIQLSELEKKAFNRHFIANSPLNIVHEMEEGFTLESLFTPMIKSIISGDDITAEIKGGAAYTFKPRTKLLVASNHIPVIKKIPDYATLRRYLVLPFHATFTADNADPKIFEKMEAEKSGIFNVAMNGHKRLVANSYRFSYAAKSEKIIQNWVSNMMPIYSFCRDHVKSCVGNSEKNSDITQLFTKLNPQTNYRNKEKMFFTEFAKALSSLEVSCISGKSNGLRTKKNIKLV